MLCYVMLCNTDNSVVFFFQPLEHTNSAIIRLRNNISEYEYPSLTMGASNQKHTKNLEKAQGKSMDPESSDR